MVRASLADRKVSVRRYLSTALLSKVDAGAAEAPFGSLLIVAALHICEICINVMMIAPFQLCSTARFMRDSSTQFLEHMDYVVIVACFKMLIQATTALPWHCRNADCRVSARVRATSAVGIS